MKIVYAGADARMSVAPLQALLAAGFDIAAVVTQPDRPVGRKRLLTPNAVKVCAQGAGLPVYCFERIRDHAAELAALGCGAMVTCAYGQILTQEVLDAFPRGVYNIHASLLPRWRGASPVQHAVLAGDEYTGVTVMRTELGLDSGDMLLSRRVLVGEKTAGELLAELSALGAEAIVEALKKVESGTAVFTPQGEEGVTFCKKIKKEDCRVDFSRPAQEVCRLVRAMCPEPLAFTTLRGGLINLLAAQPAPAEAGTGQPGEVLRADKRGILVQAGEGCVRILSLQFEGGKPLRAADAVNGRKISPGDVLGG